MKEVVIKDEYAIRGVGAESKIYDTLCKRFKDIDEDVMLDFCGLNVTTPWLNPMFCELMVNERVHIRVSEDEACVRNIEVTLKLIGCKNINRVENVYKSEIKVDPVKEKRIADFRERFAKTTEVVGDKLNIRFRLSGLTQVSSDDTIEILGDYIKEFCSGDKNIKYVEFDSTGVILGKSRITAVADMLNSSFFSDNGIVTSERDDINSDVVEKIRAHRLVDASERLSVDKRISILKQYEIKEGTVVMLSIFKKTRGVNEFGQMDDGRPSISRVAIFRGYKKEYGSEAILSFRSYKKNTFRTREDYCLDNDFNDDISEMEYQDFNFKVSEIGFMDKFTGKRAHFNYPIQFDDTGYLYGYVVGDGGSIKTVKYNLPAYAKYVFDSWEIEYNKESLDFCIKESERLLKEFEESKKN